MKTKQYNNNATRGQYEINSFQFQSIFPEANRFLIDYVLERSYFNKKDPRVLHDCADVLTFHRVRLNALSTLHGEDQFDAHDGEMIVRLKLFDKATRFLDGFRHKLNKECERMEHRLTWYPYAVIKKTFINPAVPTRQGTLLDYSITDGYSYAKWTIPVRMDTGNPTLEDICTNIADYACEALRYRKDVNFAVYASIQRFMEDFADEILNKFVCRGKRLGGGNWFIEKDHNGKMKSIVISVHTKKSPDDVHNPEKAAEELIKALNRSFRKLERLICRTAIEILHNYVKVGKITKAVAAVDIAKQYCVDKGLVKAEDYKFEALDNLLKTTVVED